MIEEADFQKIGNAAIDLCVFVEKLRLGKKLKIQFWRAERAQAMLTCFDVFINGYGTMRDAKRGAERFLRRLQEAVK
jgi:hypothetical protein